MLIPAWLYTGLFYGLLATSGIALLYYAYRPKRSDTPDRVPEARLVGARWPWLMPWLPRIMLVGGAVGAWTIHHVAVDVIRVTDDGASRMIRLGKPDWPLAPGTDGRDEYGLHDTWVYNASSHDVRIESVSYGHSFGFGGSEPTKIPPGTAYATYKLEYIGPYERPPENIEVEGVEAQIGMTSRQWLTWDE
jgi:hypothetical protein